MDVNRGEIMNEFFMGFVKGAKETPAAFFAPAIAIWKLLIGTTESLLIKPGVDGR